MSASPDVILEVRDVEMHFGGIVALDVVSFDMRRGTILGLIGPNGAGKTTLFNCVSGAFPPTAGRIVLEGRDITGLPAHRVCRAGLARTYQIVKPFG